MRLLLAEDEQALSKALKAILEHAGYTVNAVYDLSLIHFSLQSSTNLLQ